MELNRQVLLPSKMCTNTNITNICSVTKGNSKLCFIESTSPSNENDGCVVSRPDICGVERGPTGYMMIHYGFNWFYKVVSK